MTARRLRKRWWHFWEFTNRWRKCPYPQNECAFGGAFVHVLSLLLPRGPPTEAEYAAWEVA